MVATLQGWQWWINPRSPSQIVLSSADVEDARVLRRAAPSILSDRQQ